MKYRDWLLISNEIENGKSVKITLQGKEVRFGELHRFEYYHIVIRQAETLKTFHYKKIKKIEELDAQNGE